MKKRKSTKEEEAIVIEAACGLATTIHKFIAERPKLHKFGMTVIGIAVEMILSNSPHWDKSSAEFREFLEIVHNDLKGRMNEDIPS